MDNRRIFTVFSAALLSAAMLGGCQNHNSGSYSEKTDIRVTTTAFEIQDWAVTDTQTAAAAETTADTETIAASDTAAEAAPVNTTVAATQKEKTSKTVTKKDKSSKTATKKEKKPPKTTTTEAYAEIVTTGTFDADDGTYVEYHFRSQKQLNQHFEKHGAEFNSDFGYNTPAEYEKGASDVINNSEALHKIEAEDGDGVYYIEATNEFVILSTDGYIRTYFRPNGGKSYYDRQ